MVEMRQVADHELRDHVSLIGSIHFTVRTKTEIVFAPAHRDRGVVAFLEIDDVRVVVLLIDRKFRTIGELTRIDKDASVEVRAIPEETALHGQRGHYQKAE